MKNPDGSILIVASARKSEDVDWIRSMIDKHRDVWIVLDKKTAEIMARTGLLSRLDPGRIIVFKGRRGEELSLRIYRVVKPDAIYICDRYGALTVLTNLLRYAPVEIQEC